MILNYEKKYALAEVDCILAWLGEEYIAKVPKNILQKIKQNKKIGYEPYLDFTKPIENQIKQETKNIIAYLNYNYWITNEEEKRLIRLQIEANAEEEKRKKRLERQREIELKAKMSNAGTITGSIDRKLRGDLKF